jgi:hypothetical protein
VTRRDARGQFRRRGESRIPDAKQPNDARIEKIPIRGERGAGEGGGRKVKMGAGLPDWQTWAKGQAVARRRSRIRFLALCAVWAGLALLVLFVSLVAFYTVARPVSTLMLAHDRRQRLSAHLCAAEDDCAGRTRNRDCVGGRDFLRQ